MLAVFTSPHGDLPDIDDLCDTLAHTPQMVSPTRFLHTIDNAPAGRWSRLAGSGRNHTAVSAATHYFAVGLLEAAMLIETEQHPVLLVGYDTAARGALVHTTQSQGAIAAARVLSPRSDPHTLGQMDWRQKTPAPFRCTRQFTNSYTLPCTPSPRSHNPA